MAIQSASTSNFLSLATTLGVASGGGAATIAGWFKIVSGTAGDFQEALRFKGSGNDMQIYPILGGQAFMGTDNADLSIGTLPPNGTWFFVAQVWDGTNVNIYFANVGDGALTTNGGALTDTTSMTNGVLGFPNQSDGNSDVVQATNVMLWNSALTGAQVLAQLHQQAPVIPAYAWYKCANAATATTDSSGNSRTATLTGSVTDAADPTGIWSDLGAYVVQKTSGSTAGTGTTEAVAFTANVLAGSFIHVWATWLNTGGITASVAGSLNGSYGSALDTVVGATQSTAHWVFTGASNVGSAAGAETVTVTFSGTTTNKAATIAEIGKVSALQVHAAQSQTAPGTGTDAVTSGNVTPTSQPALVVGLANGLTTSPPVPGTNFTSNGTADWALTSVTNAKSEQRRITSTSAQGATFTAVTGSAVYQTLVAVYTEAGGAPVIHYADLVSTPAFRQTTSTPIRLPANQMEPWMFTAKTILKPFFEETGRDTRQAVTQLPPTAKPWRDGQKPPWSDRPYTAVRPWFEQSNAALRPPPLPDNIPDDGATSVPPKFAARPWADLFDVKTPPPRLTAKAQESAVLDALPALRSWVAELPDRVAIRQPTQPTLEPWSRPPFVSTFVAGPWLDLADLPRGPAQIIIRAAEVVVGMPAALLRSFLPDAAQSIPVPARPSAPNQRSVDNSWWAPALTALGTWLDAERSQGTSTRPAPVAPFQRPADNPWWADPLAALRSFLPDSPPLAQQSVPIAPKQSEAWSLKTPTVATSGAATFAGDAARPSVQSGRQVSDPWSGVRLNPLGTFLDTVQASGVTAPAASVPAPPRRPSTEVFGALLAKLGTVIERTPTMPPFVPQNAPRFATTESFSKPDLKKLPDPPFLISPKSWQLPARAFIRSATDFLSRVLTPASARKNASATIAVDVVRLSINVNPVILKPGIDSVTLFIRGD